MSRSFDEIVASFVPHVEEHAQQQSTENKLDKTRVVEKAVPPLQLAATFASSSTDSNDEEIALENKLPTDGEEDEEDDNRSCRRSTLCWIVIGLVGVFIILGLVFFAVATKQKSDNQQGTLVTGSVFPGSPDSPEKHDNDDHQIPPEKHDYIDDQQMVGPVSSGQLDTKVPMADPITLMPTESNSNNEPSDVPSLQPSMTSSPSNMPSRVPPDSPSNMPSRVPSGYPTASPFNLFNYGESLYTNDELGIQLTVGLNAKLIARRNTRVKYADGSESTRRFHEWLDGAGVAPLPNGGYVYVSNSEHDAGKAGVFGLYFNKDGGITNYKALLTGTTWNCGGKEKKIEISIHDMIVSPNNVLTLLLAL